MDYSPLPRDEHERYEDGVIPHDLDMEAVACRAAFLKALEDNKLAEEAPDIWD